MVGNKCKGNKTTSEFLPVKPAEIAVAFAKVVTVPSDLQDDWVARNGDKSIFSALRDVLPELTNAVNFP